METFFRSTRFSGSCIARLIVSRSWLVRFNTHFLNLATSKANYECPTTPRNTFQRICGGAKSVKVHSRGEQHITFDPSNRVVHDVNSPSACNLQNFLLPAVLRIVDNKVRATNCTCDVKLGRRSTSNDARAKCCMEPAKRQHDNVSRTLMWGGASHESNLCQFGLRLSPRRQLRPTRVATRLCEGCSK
jgi:hypothetical protein